MRLYREEKKEKHKKQMSSGRHFAGLRDDNGGLKSNMPGAWAMSGELHTASRFQFLRTWAFYSPLRTASVRPYAIDCLPRPLPW